MKRCFGERWRHTSSVAMLRGRQLTGNSLLLMLVLSCIVFIHRDHRDELLGSVCLDKNLAITVQPQRKTMAIKPWYKVATPREDLREGKPLDASEFAVHLDQIREGRASTDYQNPELFFERTYLTTNLTGLAAECVRRLSGERTETSAVFNMATQFGGGKTHALTLLYHLVHNGSKANGWQGVSKILEPAGVKAVQIGRASCR